jgi:DNA-binding winged helix-turn-helix (wHTH) protein
VSYTFGEFELDVDSWELRERGQPVPVQPKALAVLTYLVRNRERVVPRQELFDAVWPGVTVGPNSVAQAVASIRRLLHDEGGSILRTVQTRGYRFAAPIEQRPSTTDVARETGAPFVGRAAILEQMLGRLERARAGRGDVVLLSGPPGIGKSRVASEFQEVARTRQGRLLQTVCYEQDQRPLSPWHRLQASADHAQAQGEPDGAALFAGPGASGEDPFRLFERARDWLSDVARLCPPLVITLEDAHWADSASLLLLKFLARGIAELPILLVVTYRDAPIDPAFGRVLGAVCAEDPARRIELEGLDLKAACELGERLCQDRISVELISQIWHKARGNPLFLTQMLHVVKMAGLDEPSSRMTSTLLAPETVREAIAEHLGSLSEPCRNALSVAAVFGLEFRLDALTCALARKSGEIIGLLDEACRARVVVPAPGAYGAFRFRHEVVRDVLYRKLSLLERVRWHRAAGLALAELYDAGTVEDPLPVAEHLMQGASSVDGSAEVTWLHGAAVRLWKAGDEACALSLMEAALKLAAPPLDAADDFRRRLLTTLDAWATSEPRQPAAAALLAKYGRPLSD